MTTPERPPQPPSTPSEIDSPVIPSTPTSDPAPVGTVVTGPAQPPVPPAPPGRRLSERAKELAQQKRAEEQRNRERDRIERERREKQHLRERADEAVRHSMLRSWFSGQRWEGVRVISATTVVVTDLPDREIQILLTKNGPTYSARLLTGSREIPLEKATDLGDALLDLENLPLEGTT